MSQLPTEVLIRIGSFLIQPDQKECSLVCKQWHAVFVGLIFSKAVLATHEQLKGYLSQQKELKALTVSLHLIAPIIHDKTFAIFVKRCPNVKHLTLFSNATHKLQVAPAVDLIYAQWAKTLTNIRMDTALLSKLVPLMANQLEGITGNLFGLISSETGKLVSLPRLKTLEIEPEGEMSRLLSARRLTLLCQACPSLTSLTINHMELDEDLATDLSLEPFSFKSLHFKDCNNASQEVIGQFLRTFCNLEEFSLLRAPERYRSPSMKGVHPAILDFSPKLRSLGFDYCYKSPVPSKVDFNKSLAPLKSLRTVHIEFDCELDTIVKREKLSFSGLLDSIPQARNLTIYGNAHLFTTDGLDHYLIGKIGSYDDYVANFKTVAISHEEYRLQFPKEPKPERTRYGYDSEEDDDDYGYYNGYSMRYGDESSVDSLANAGDFIPVNKFTWDDERLVKDPDRSRLCRVRTVNKNHYQVMLDKDQKVIASQGEILMERGTNIVTTQRKHAMYTGEDTPFSWDNSLSWDCDLLQPLPFESYTFKSSLTVLKLEKVTLRNPTYHWINACCPLLTELYILETDLYPLCEVYVKDLKRLNILSLTFDRFYCEPLAIETICNGNSRYYTLADNEAGEWNYVEEKSDLMLEDMKYLSFYKITINYADTLGALTVAKKKLDIYT